MSIESLVFLAIFLLLPVIERLIERNRRRGPVPREDDDPLDPMGSAPPRRRPRAEIPPPSRPPPPPMPVETRKPEPAPIRAPQRPAVKPRSAEPPAVADVVPAEVLRAVRARERALAQRAATAAATMATRAPAGPTRKAVGRILRNPRSMRRAFAIAVVLGPCKALEHER